MVSAWPEPPSAMTAGSFAGAHDGVAAFALSTTETPTGHANGHRVVRTALGMAAALTYLWALAQPLT